MAVATATALALAGMAASAAGTVGAAAMQSNAAQRAAEEQTTQAGNAADREFEMFRIAMGLQAEQQGYERDRAQATAEARRPYLSLIEAALGGGAPGTPGVTDPQFQPYDAAQPFSAPDPNQITDDPAFRFRMEQGQQALERSASARGTLLTTGTLRDVTAFGQGLASEEYDKIYGRRLGEHTLNEAQRASAYDRNTSNQFAAADMRNRNALGVAGLQQQGYQSYLNNLLALAGLAVPDAYAGGAPRVRFGDGDARGSITPTLPGSGISLPSIGTGGGDQTIHSPLTPAPMMDAPLLRNRSLLGGR